MLAAMTAVIALACEPTTQRRFLATFSTPEDFYDRFEYGWSGMNPVDSHSGAVLNWQGDHNAMCGTPDTKRPVALSGTDEHRPPGAQHSGMDFTQTVWWCAPGDDPAKGHLMTGVNTFGYNHVWFSPNDYLTNVKSVCWDQNITGMSSRKWTEVQFVGPEDATRHPEGMVLDHGGAGVARSSHLDGFDLGYGDPGFRRGEPNMDPNNGLRLPGERDTSGNIVQGPRTLAGLTISSASIFQWWQEQSVRKGDGGSWPGFNLENPGGPQVTDVATRYTHCIVNMPNNRVMILQVIPDGLPTTGVISNADNRPGDGKPDVRMFSIEGQIPQGPVRVVFHDSNYDPPKAEDYSPNVLTWHWDNVNIVYDPGEVGPISTTDARELESQLVDQSAA